MVNFSEQSTILDCIKNDKYGWRTINGISKQTGLNVRKVVLCLGLCANDLIFKTNDAGQFLVKYKEKS